MPASARFVLPLSLAALAAGCLAPGLDPAGGVDLAGGSLSFTPLALIDDVRAGGEPVIQITPRGTILVAAHPGWTHVRPPPGPNLVAPAEAQSYLWRSTDNGSTFAPVAAIGGAPAGPKGPWVGVSDPDFAVDAEGRVYFTDLGGLAYTSVLRSDDDGATWTLGNPVMPGPVDRQWLAAYGSDVWFVANYFQEERVLKSSDGGITWTRVGASHCGGDVWADPLDGTLYQGCGNAIDVSTDGGATWEVREVPDSQNDYRAFAEPLTDSAGTVYTTWTTRVEESEETEIWLASSKDKGATWSAPVAVSRPLGLHGTHFWPWLVVGDPGRVAVAWLGTENATDPAIATGDWFVYQATILAADTDAPVVTAARATDAVHVGPICQGGTGCQADPESTGDRRLGDFFEAAVDAEGRVHIVVASTTLVEDTIAHPAYVRQEGGPLLRASAS